MNGTNLTLPSGKLTYGKWTRIEDVFPIKNMGIFQPAILVYQKDTVDGRNPKQPPGMVKTLKIMGESSSLV